MTNSDGTPKYIRAENDYQYPKYNADGSLMMKDVPMNYIAERFRQVTVRPLDEAVIQATLNKAEGGMSEEENAAMLAQAFTAGNLPFVKGKTESALRRNGKSHPEAPYREAATTIPVFMLVYLTAVYGKVSEISMDCPE